jgi:hypothetical protein
LAVFAQLLDENGDFIAGNDGLWVDPYTLQVGDTFRQIHTLTPSPNATSIIFGMYDPKTNQRIPTNNGEQFVILFP